MPAVHDIPVQALLLYASMRWRHYLQVRGAWTAAARPFAGRRRMIIVTAQ